ncbi:serine/threonine-protein kinase [Enhygromyxa salina]|uniref:Serine/threonine-protein kinase PrkC n=1 Tax=Enhygromyxa salina TaxID=215803 RepID=A0A2S9YVA1_9BACT|nr:serine/threonine-protein kinase [Enhygromyxa salina]PRQ09028.1 Serine/threonine-protein kinase PrkC [Enhygromyxa salina]
MAFDDQLGDETQPGILSSTRDPQVGGYPAGSRRGVEVAIGDRLGDYEIERRLGAGGMGEVFAARSLATGERVALKVLAQAGSTALYRFKREFRALADVTHPNLIALHELVIAREGPPFFTMELVDGVPFTEYVRGHTPAGHLPNLVRLGRSLGQLVVGIHHLHLAQCLHRDVKPSNVLVSRGGRVVILDFGLVSELDVIDVGMTRDGAPLGTPAYMAPEQAIAGKTTPGSDLYAIGVMLFECLTGELPFRGSAIEVMIHKQEGEIPDPRMKVPGVSAELRSMCMRLLARDPESRPSGPELLAAFEQMDFDLGPGSWSGAAGIGAGVGLAAGPGGSGVFAGASMSSGSIASGDPRLGSRAPFIGRKRELAQLGAALRDVEEIQAAVTVHVYGASGFGKSALLARFLGRVRRKHDALVLSGRCLERESVPYKGVDAIIDALSVQLRRMPEVEVAALQPRALGPLTRIFPVLGDVWSKPAFPGPAEATELRRQGLAALRELVQRVSDRRPLVVCIDDFQWADIDSVRLLNSLIRPPDAPAMLVLLGFRDDLELKPGSREAVAELTSADALEGRDVRDLQLGPLDQGDAVDLTMKLMGEAAEPTLARSLVEQAGANPFYLGQLVLGGRAQAEGAGNLDEIVARRLVDLDHARRTLLALVAAAGGPVPIVALDGVELEGPSDSIGSIIDELCALGLLTRPRTHDPHDPHQQADTKTLDRSAWAVETAHGRIREVVLSELEPDELRGVHVQLAELLEQHGGDLETLAEQFAQGGAAERAAEYSERAAVQAAQALAFARAAELYERTLELLPATAPAAKRRALRLALAHQLINLGRGASASDILLELAVVSNPDEGRSLRQRAAEQLLRAGRLDEGLDLSRTLFTELGEPMPRGFWGAVWMIVRERGRLWWRSLFGAAKLRPEAEVSAQLLTRLDVIANVATGLSLQEIILTQALHARALVLAREAGEPRRLGIVLSYEFVAHAAVGRTESARRMMIECRELATRVDDVELDRAIDLSEAMVDWFGGRMPKARARLAHLLRRIEASPGADWIRAYAAIRYAETCVYSGQLGELRRELPRWIMTAREHGNLHELASLHGVAATVSLYFDDLDGAKRNLDAGRECWDASRYTVPDLTLDLSAANVLLYAGEVERARAEVASAAASVRSSGMGRLPLISVLIEQARARVVLWSAVREPNDLELRREVARGCKLHHKIKDPLQLGEARINEAALCSIMGDREGMRRCWRDAQSHFEDNSMGAMLAAVRLRLAGQTKGRESAELEALGDAYLREQGIPNRARFLDLIAPMHDGRRAPGS